MYSGLMVKLEVGLNNVLTRQENSAMTDESNTASG
jgi:hypothetical protein